MYREIIVSLNMLLVMSGVIVGAEIRKSPNRMQERGVAAGLLSQKEKKFQAAIAATVKARESCDLMDIQSWEPELQVEKQRRGVRKGSISNRLPMQAVFRDGARNSSENNWKENIAIEQGPKAEQELAALNAYLDGLNDRWELNSVEIKSGVVDEKGEKTGLD